MKTLKNFTKFSYGSTSAILTSIGLIIGLHSTINARLNIVIGLLLIAIADNFSDSLGIHIYQESEEKPLKEAWLLTATNFLSRFFVSMSFVLIILLFPLNFAIILSIAWGMSLLAYISYVIAKDKNKILPVAEHLLLAAVIILISFFLSAWIKTSIK